MQVRQEKKHHRFRISILFIIVLLSFGGCFLYYMYNDNEVSFLDDKETETITTIDETEAAIVYITDQTKNESVISNPVPQSEKKGNDYITSCIFVGDSVIEGMTEGGLISPDNTITGDNIRIKLVNSATVNEKDKPVSVSKKLAIMGGNNIYIVLGTDSMDSMTNEAMLEEYKSFLNSVLSDNNGKNIYIVSVPPVTEERENDRVSPVLNSSVKLFNTALLDIADEMGVYYIDVNSALSDSQGKLKPEYSESDGKTLSEDGNKVFLEYILSHTV